MSENEKVTPEMLEQFDRLGEVVDTHGLLCQCEEYCLPFLDLGDEIRRLSAQDKVRTA